MNSSVLPFLFNHKFISFSIFNKLYPYYSYCHHSPKKIFILDSIIEPIDPFIDEIRFR